eukprot:TRINITY_DN2056_c0_g1_i4.p1 TRINITY_DN2056_c0_g1~~TRINITY_DN2056_c0_g1_i4.p1  ORF type:complete len:623 (-),score=118.11 TRINITY_DN2056_c0_g1_i4:468-2336(-)
MGDGSFHDAEETPMTGRAPISIDYTQMHRLLLTRKHRPQLLVHPDCAASRVAKLYLLLCKIDFECISSDTPKGKFLLTTIDIPALPALVVDSDCISECHEILRMLATLPRSNGGEIQDSGGWYDEEGRDAIDLWLRWRYVSLGRAVVDQMTRKSLARRPCSAPSVPASRLVRCLRIMDKALRHRRFLCSNRRPTLADLSVAGALVDLELLDVDWARFPSLCTWYEDMASRFPSWAAAFDPVYFKVARRRGFTLPSDAMTHLGASVYADSLFDFFDPEWQFLCATSSSAADLETDMRHALALYAAPLTRTEERALIERNLNARRIDPAVGSASGSRGALGLGSGAEFRFLLEPPIGSIRVMVEGRIAAGGMVPVPRRVQEMQALCLYLQRFYPHSRLELLDPDGRILPPPRSSSPTAWADLLPALSAIHVRAPPEHRNFNKPLRFSYRPSALPLPLPLPITISHTTPNSTSNPPPSASSHSNFTTMPRATTSGSGPRSRAISASVAKPGSAPGYPSPLTSRSRSSSKPAGNVPVSPNSPQSKSPPKNQGHNPLKGRSQGMDQDSLPQIPNASANTATASMAAKMRSPRTPGKISVVPQPCIPTPGTMIALPNLGIRSIRPIHK